MTLINKHLDMLGMNAEDKVTGFRGVVACISRPLRLRAGACTSWRRRGREAPGSELV